MTDNTNIEVEEIRQFMDQYRKEYPAEANYSDEKIQYNLDRGWILGWCMARCAAFSNAEPTAWRVTMPNGKERGIWSNYDDVEISISGLEGNIITPLFLHPSVPAPLSDKQVEEIASDFAFYALGRTNLRNLVRSIEQAHGIGLLLTNTGEQG